MIAQDISFSFPSTVCVMGGGKTGRACIACIAAFMEDLHAAHARAACEQDTPAVSNTSYANPCAALTQLDFYPGNTTLDPKDIERFTRLGIGIYPEVQAPVRAYDLCITSPGISPQTAFYQAFAAASREMIGEPELAWRLSPAHWLGITGTNGKTTTTTLVRDILIRAHTPCVAVGNIGECCIDHVRGRADDEWFSAELSSFQLEESVHLHPHVAVLLNITPDHIEWHGSLEAYAHAKEKIFSQLTPNDYPILSRDDAWCKAIFERLCARGLSPICIDTDRDPKTQRAAYCADNALFVRLEEGKDIRITDLSSVSLKGTHNIQNMLAAAAVARAIGIDPSYIARVFAEFKSLEHRLEAVATKNGISFVNDSKATNPDSVIKALSAYPASHIILLLGGHDKHTDLSQFALEVVRKCKLAVCFGEAGARFEEALLHARTQSSNGCCACASSDLGEAKKASVALDNCGARGGAFPACEIVRAAKLKDAFHEALAHAHQGDIVLLSPACSSFDEFHNMAERGRYFKALVKAL